MAYIERRVFFGKVGKGGQLVEHLKQLEELFKGGPSVKFRVLSDFMSGRTDRIVYEAEVEDWAAYQQWEQGLGESANAQRFGEWFAALAELIDYAEVEVWQTH